MKQMKTSHELAERKWDETIEKQKAWCICKAAKRVFQEGDLVLILSTCR